MVTSNFQSVKKTIVERGLSKLTRVNLRFFLTYPNIFNNNTLPFKNLINMK